MLMADSDLIREFKAAIDSGKAAPEIAPYVPEVAFCSRATFEATREESNGMFSDYHRQRLIDSRGRGHVMGLFSTRLYAAGL
jgi:hypothetical protein